MSPATAVYFDTLLPGTSWVPRSVLDDIYAAVAVDGGDEAVRRLNLEVVRQSYAPLLRQFVETLMSLVGRNRLKW